MVFAILLIAVNPSPVSAAALDEVRVTRDLQYGTDQGDVLLLDVYQPSAATSPRPVVILIHGGGWASGDKARYEPFARSLAVAGFVVFDINYALDLSQSPGFPRQVDDVHAALAWIRDHAGQYDGDANRIAVAGGSAGGYLAAMLGTQANNSTTTPVRAVISLSGPMDLVALVADLRQAVTPDSGQCAPMSCAALDQGTRSLRNLLGCDPLQCPEQLLREASPITYVTAASPPFFLANSTEEVVPATQAAGMATALRDRGVPVNVELVPGDRHSVAYVPSISRSLLTFLTTHDGESPPATASSVAEQPGEAQGHGRAWLLRWLVVAAAVCSLAAMAVTRRRASGGAHPLRSDPLEPSATSGDRR
jgi:triacylglycerol lipase/alpha-L-fucosidase 2